MQYYKNLKQPRENATRRKKSSAIFERKETFRIILGSTMGQNIFEGVFSFLCEIALHDSKIIFEETIRNMVFIK